MSTLAMFPRLNSEMQPTRPGLWLVASITESGAPPENRNNNSRLPVRGNISLRGPLNKSFFVLTIAGGGKSAEYHGSWTMDLTGDFAVTCQVANFFLLLTKCKAMGRQ